MSDDQGLDARALARYSRQLILPGFGAPAQRALQNARVLVVGAGGLGCPAVQYLAAAGVGTITVVDADHVEASNLSRQILHSDARVGMNKAQSIAQAISTLNPFVTVRAVEAQFGPENAVSLVEAHDLVLDCTDNVLTRYLISDAGVLADKPILSGAAQGYEGQLITLHQSLGGEQRGPCYRCLFPQSPRPEHTQSCDDGGILGCVTGLVGTWQAMEAIKVLTGLGDKTPNMLFFTPMSIPQVRSVRVRPRQVHLPWDTIRRDSTAAKATIMDAADGRDILMLCRRGNDSREATRLLQLPHCFNVRGGLRSYATVDTSFPMY
ncbi:molybdenum cofactor biosynthetic protein [Malassezia pachydermatis]|uniref:Molybdenum cofactor biosynthetic protein n=1 Tax=Malassezia pachydermatis TaxID=77020 RepID=A0A0M9VPX4_9BASI|nr:molybdenum cofactor biosynthetic protein [Malassezia pachydermatis]KOS14912.1 molybdenum cofactor biosynthetic protein [Malassezia pachydermatis]